MLLAEESGDSSSEMKDQEHALSKSVDIMASSIESSTDLASEKEKHREYEQACRDKFSDAVQPQPEVKDDEHINQQDGKCKASNGPDSKSYAKPFYKLTMLAYQRKVVVLHELLSACLAVTPELDKKVKRQRNGYDARHRVALRLLSTWFNIESIKMVSFFLPNVLSCFLYFMKSILTLLNMPSLTVDNAQYISVMFNYWLKKVAHFVNLSKTNMLNINEILNKYYSQLRLNKYQTTEEYP